MIFQGEKLPEKYTKWQGFHKIGISGKRKREGNWHIVDRSFKQCSYQDKWYQIPDILGIQFGVKTPSFKLTSCAYPYFSQQLFLSSDYIKQETTHKEMVPMPLI